uniref:Mitochondrial inner membrane protease subunit 2 n=1 Tax=Globodera rostochiensis TaxID=31243 RepID=A0A914IBQ0_GLORO
MILKVIGSVVFGACIAQVFGKRVGAIIICRGDSMLPNFHNGDILWARVWKPRHGLYPGDVVCLVNPQNANEYVLKRVSVINGRGRPASPLTGRIEVRGDNAAVSVDSRDYGPVPAGLVHYRVSARLFPRTDLPHFITLFRPILPISMFAFINFDKFRMWSAIGAVGVAVVYGFDHYLGRFAICTKDNLRYDLKRWDFLWCGRWNAHTGEVLKPGTLVYSLHPMPSDIYAFRKYGYFFGEVNAVKTTVCVCCRNRMASKVLLTLPKSDAEDEQSAWVQSGMVRYRASYRLWPFHRIGRVVAAEEIPFVPTFGSNPSPSLTPLSSDI